MEHFFQTALLLEGKADIYVNEKNVSGVDN